MGEELWQEYQRQRLNRKARKRQFSNAENVVNWRRRTKLKLIEYKGGKCDLCGFDKKVCSAYDFHHKDPKQKDFNISAKSCSYERLKLEADKCNLVCRNCHAEIHDKIYEETRKSTIDRMSKRLLDFETAAQLKKDILQQKILTVDELLKNNKKDKKINTYVLHKKVERPSKEELEKMVNETPMITIGKKYGVSDNAVKKWCRKYGIQLINRQGYWAKKKKEDKQLELAL